MLKKSLLAITLIASSSTLMAEARYVTDQFSVMLRSGESSTHKIVRMLSSGTKVTVLNSNKKTGYTKVRLSNGKEGYILSRQLMPQPSARELLGDAQKQLQVLQEEPDKLSAKLVNLQQKFKVLSSEHKKLIEEKETQSIELDKLRQTSSNAVRIANERNELRKRTTNLIQELEEIKQQNRELTNKSNQFWVLTGAGILLGGIILGVILPHIRFRKRKSDWGTL